MNDQSNISVSIPADLERFISEMVASGRCESPSEVVTLSLRMLQLQDEAPLDIPPEMLEEVQKGLDQLDRGECKTIPAGGSKAYFEGLMAEGRRRLQAEQQREQK